MGTSESLQAGSPAESPGGTEVLRSRDASFVVVGVGASAGGLEALSDLLANLPEKTGMAVVVVQHLDPQHESKLSNLLSRVTHLPVVEAMQDLAVQPDHVYIIPRNMTMTIAQGVLQLAFEEPRHEPAAVSGSAADAKGPNGPARWLPRWLRRPFRRATTSVAAGVSAPPDEGEVDRLRQELAAMRDYLQSVIEQKDTVIEEILCSNEELQSTNDELETAKEELQSVNEELVTVNEQLMSRNLELTRVSDDMTNLLGSANVPIVAVGVDLRIRKFTPAAGKVLNLLPADVGRPIGELKSVVEVSDLEALITGVIDTARSEEREVRDQAGHWYTLCVRPYRTAENKIDGAVVVFGDIDEAKQAQMRLKESGEYAQSIVETVREPMLILTEDLRVKSANQSFYQTFRVKPEETENLFLYDLGSGQWNIPSLRTLLEDILPGHHTIEEYEVEHDFPVIGHRVMLLNARRVCPRDGAATHPPGVSGRDRAPAGGAVAAELGAIPHPDRNDAPDHLHRQAQRRRGLLQPALDRVHWPVQPVDRELELDAIRPPRRPGGEPRSA